MHLVTKWRITYYTDNGIITLDTSDGFVSNILRRAAEMQPPFPTQVWKVVVELVK